MTQHLRLIGLTLLLCVSSVSAQQDNTLILLTHDSFNVSESVLAQFTEETGITVEILRAGDTGVLVNQSILSRDNPLGDVLFGVDNTFLSRALAADLFVPYESPLLQNVADEFKVDVENRVTPIDYGDVCLNYDAAYFAENNLPVPQTLVDLVDPAYRGLLVVENPATSSPGLAFLLTTVSVFGTTDGYTYLEYWADLVNNDVLVVDDWTTAYYTEFSGSAESVGQRPLVVSYASSPPVEVYFMEQPPESAPTGVITAPQTCFRQIEFAGILQGTGQIEQAQQFIDFMLSETFQDDVPLQMFVYPVNPEAELPEIFTEYSQIAEAPVTMPIEEIEANRETWIQAWTETVLR
jgi:thiamine transport system substrate-binding protein